MGKLVARFQYCIESSNTGMNSALTEAVRRKAREKLF